MDDIGGVHEEESPEQLIDEVLDVIIREILSGIDDSVEISFHELGDDVDVAVAGFVLWFEEIDHADDILVFEKL